MAAESFQDFIISYLIRLCLIIFFRTYISPILKNLQFFIRKIATWITVNYPQFAPYIQNYTVAAIQDKNIKFYLGMHQNQQVQFQEE